MRGTDGLALSTGQILDLMDRIHESGVAPKWHALRVALEWVADLAAGGAVPAVHHETEPAAQDGCDIDVSDFGVSITVIGGAVAAFHHPDTGAAVPGDTGPGTPAVPSSAAPEPEPESATPDRAEPEPLAEPAPAPRAAPAPAPQPAAAPVEWRASMTERQIAAHLDALPPDAFWDAARDFRLAHALWTGEAASGAAELLGCTRAEAIARWRLLCPVVSLDNQRHLNALLKARLPLAAAAPIMEAAG